jgi:hypothetical protein
MHRSFFWFIVAGLHLQIVIRVDPHLLWGLPMRGLSEEGTDVYSPQLFEMLAPVIHDQRLADAERKRLANTLAGDVAQVRPGAMALRQLLARWIRSPRRARAIIASPSQALTPSP